MPRKKKDAEIESQDPVTGEWADETEAETVAADEAGVPVGDAPKVESQAVPGELQAFRATVTELNDAEAALVAAQGARDEAQAAVTAAETRVSQAARQYVRATDTLRASVG